MTPIVVWLLIATSGRGSPAVIARFDSERECLYTESVLHQKSLDRPGMSTIFGVCVSAKEKP